MGISSPLTRRAIFLDRDGVLNRVLIRNGRPFPPLSLAEVEIPPDVPIALSRLRTAGFLLIVVTNQPDVARGIQRLKVVESINAALAQELPLDAFRVCYHDDSDNCECRKPAAGLLLATAREMRLDLTASFMIGDRWRDIEAGRRAGCTTILIDRGYAEHRPTNFHVRVRSLAEAADYICSSQGGTK